MKLSSIGRPKAKSVDDLSKKPRESTEAVTDDPDFGIVRDCLKAAAIKAAEVVAFKVLLGCRFLGHYSVICSLYMAFADGTCGRLAHLVTSTLKVYQFSKISLNFHCCIRSWNLEVYD